MDNMIEIYTVIYSPSGNSDVAILGTYNTRGLAYARVESLDPDEYDIDNEVTVVCTDLNKPANEWCW